MVPLHARTQLAVDTTSVSPVAPRRDSTGGLLPQRVQCASTPDERKGGHTLNSWSPPCQGQGSDPHHALTCGAGLPLEVVKVCRGSSLHCFFVGVALLRRCWAHSSFARWCPGLFDRLKWTSQFSMFWAAAEVMVGGLEPSSHLCLTAMATPGRRCQEMGGRLA